jgi:hypothetical protein
MKAYLPEVNTMNAPLLKSLCAASLATLLMACQPAPEQADSGFTISGNSAEEGDKSSNFGGLFAEGKRFENFRSIDKFIPVKTIPAASQPAPLPEALSPIEFSGEYLGQQLSLEQFLAQTSSSGFLAIVDGKIIDERYFHGNSPEAMHAGFSMTKSIVSALVGAAIADGAINSVNDLVTDYIPELNSPTFQGVTIKHVLQMASGVKFDENYQDPNSDINKMSQMVQTMPYVDYINTLEREREPGTFNHYASINTHILGIIVANATGTPLAEYLSAKIWQPAGMEHSAQWMIDNWGKELPMGGITVSLRDYGKFGLIYANDGQFQGKQILPASWVKESVVPDAPYLQPGKHEGSDTLHGYQYQWWTPVEPQGEFMAKGIWGQTIFVDPANKVVLVKLSADPSYFSPEVRYAQAAYLQALSHSLAK